MKHRMRSRLIAKKNAPCSGISRAIPSTYMLQAPTLWWDRKAPTALRTQLRKAPGSGAGFSKRERAVGRGGRSQLRLLAPARRLLPSPGGLSSLSSRLPAPFHHGGENPPATAGLGLGPTCQKAAAEGDPPGSGGGRHARSSGWGLPAARGALSRQEKGLRRAGAEGARGAAPLSGRSAEEGSLLRSRLRFSRSIAGGFLKPGE